MHFSVEPRGPFSLANQNAYFGGWGSFGDEPGAIAMAFPIEGARTSAAVIVRQRDDERVHGQVYGADDGAAETAWSQALAALSLDFDGSGYAEVGRRDPVVGGLQAQFGLLRPVCFYSPYEAAAAFIIGHRVSIRQQRAMRDKLAREIGDAVNVDGQRLFAFPRPEALLELHSFPGIAAAKFERLHAVAEAALAGRLDRAYLRGLGHDAAIAELRQLPGVGPFFAQGIYLRGAGVADEITDEAITLEAIQHAYGLPSVPDTATQVAITDAWRPYRMWTSVLLHVWWRRERGR